MVTVHVCIGSACHLKGSYSVIDTLQKLIQRDHREKEVELKAAFCLGHCTGAVSVKVDDGEIHSVTPESIESFYQEQLVRRG